MTYLTILLSIVAASGGFVILHFGLTHRTYELRVAGWMLVIGAIVNTFCMFYLPEFPEAPPNRRLCVVPSDWFEALPPQGDEPMPQRSRYRQSDL